MLVTNISPVSSRTERTRDRLLTAAISLFDSQGYDATTVTQIAQRAGVSEMTFFRYFPSKEDTVIADPYDPVLAEAAARQPRELGPVVRIVRAMRELLTAMPEDAVEVVRTRVAIVARTPALRAATWRAMGETEAVVTAALSADGCDPLRAKAAAAAVLAASAVALMEWAQSGDRPEAAEESDRLGGGLQAYVERALELFDPVGATGKVAVDV